jgi:hypothetical protein
MIYLNHASKTQRKIRGTTDMAKMKDYYEFLQMLYRLDTDALRVMLEYECDDFKRQLIEGEIGARS